MAHYENGLAMPNFET